jgi:hypothetical protein
MTLQYRKQTYSNLYDGKSITTSTSAETEKELRNKPTSGNSTFLNTFDDYQFHELDLINIAKLGEQWFGESFDIKQDQNLNLISQT